MTKKIKAVEPFVGFSQRQDITCVPISHWELDRYLASGLIHEKEPGRFFKIGCDTTEFIVTYKLLIPLRKYPADPQVLEAIEKYRKGVKKDHEGEGTDIQTTGI